MVTSLPTAIIQAGSPYDFAIQARDVYGNDLRSAITTNVLFRAVYTTPGGDPMPGSALTRTLEGLYNELFVATVVGDYTVTIQLGTYSAHVSASPCWFLWLCSSVEPIRVTEELLPVARIYSRILRA